MITTFGKVNLDILISAQILFEKRIGARAMVEIELPVIATEWERESDGDKEGVSKWYGGVGDLAIEHQRHAFFHSLDIGTYFLPGCRGRVPHRRR